ncbi:MAG: pyridoxal phosphate-dependent aminotransferase, partial [Acidimicrobiia bacterium]
TMAITTRANELRARGERVIGYGAGEPDFPTPDHIVEAAAAACRDPRNHRYSPTAGLPELRQAIAEKTRRDSGLEVPPSQVLVTNGGKQAVYAACAALLDPGDEVLLPAPYWVTYPPAIELAGATVVTLPTTVTSEFRVTVDQLEAARTERTKLVVFVSPSNPSGAVYQPEEVAAIGRWAADHGVWVLADEIYEHLVYGNNRFVSLPVVAPEAAGRCVVINGVAKSYAMAGWRVGWLIGPEPVVAAAARLQSHTTSNVANVSQRAALAAVSGDLEAVRRMREAFDRRRKLMYSMLDAIPGVSCLEPQGAFYAFPSLQGLLGRHIGGGAPQTTGELAEALLDEIRIAVIPGEPFGGPGYARLSFALGDEDLVEGLERLTELVARLG